LSALFLAGLLQITSGCAAARLTQFHNFAQAGTAYTKASQVVLDEAGTAAIEADSLIAQKGRDGLRTADERRQFINGENQELRKRLVLLGDIEVVVHPLGGCPIGGSSTEGVVNSNGQVYNTKAGAETVYDGLYVLDASIIPGAVAVNPTLSIVSMAARAVKSIA
jgi:choline dehydrogenase-like flavoprotein